LDKVIIVENQNKVGLIPISPSEEPIFLILA